MNNMKKIAEILGVELEEEFTVELFKEDRFKFTADGLFVYSRPTKTWEKSLFMTEILTGEFEIIKLPKQILTEKEKKYLSDFIEPFKSQVTYIEKRYLKDFKDNEKEFISIGIKENEKYWRHMELPLYDAGKYYKGMNTNECYTLEELLGL